MFFFFFSSRRRHTRCSRDWSSDVCSSDLAAVGPEHAWLRDQGRVEYTYATDDQALQAFMRLAQLEGIIPALESAHAIAEVIQRAPKLAKDKVVIVNLSGRGDKDVAQVAAKVGLEIPK